MSTHIVSFLAFLFFSQNLLAKVQMDWTENSPIPINGFQNPYQMGEEELDDSIYRGRVHALQYPVNVTGLLVPYEPVKTFFNDRDESDPLKKFFRKLGKSFAQINKLDDLMKWLGLHKYPDISTRDQIYGIPYPNGKKPDYRMGFSLMEHNNAKGFTISCAVCHSHNLFGKKILGLTNRFPRANEFFVKGKTAVTASPSFLFKWLTNATPAEKEMFQRTKENINSVQAKKPIQLGLDTSLAHVALSLAHRRDDAYATKDYWSYTEPREEPLGWVPSDSKPGVWWNVKYKNKWLLDGSVVSGNPILTNILWNEIGRGSDLKELEQWFIDKYGVIQDLTNAVYHNQAPHFTDFFDAQEHFDMAQLKQGQKLYNNMCAKCHGKYLKKWDLHDAHRFSFTDQLKTYEVIMPKTTKVMDVGTDKYRYKAMKSLKALNKLAISNNNNIEIKVQRGYVPPPLVGIWARWPYFHNNSVPNLCALLSPQAERPKKYWAGEAIDKERDFDSTCNGYPLGDSTPKSWQKNREYLFNTAYRGKSRAGHDQRIFIKKGKNLLDKQKRQALIRFLQTL